MYYLRTSIILAIAVIKADIASIACVIKMIGFSFCLSFFCFLPIGLPPFYDLIIPRKYVEVNKYLVKISIFHNLTRMEVSLMAKGKYEYWLTPDGLLRLEAYARDGLTDEQIASNMGIRRETLYDWKKKYPNISNALKRGKEVIDIQVENALLKRALGYTFTETTSELMNDGSMKVTKKVEKEVQPDTTAQIFWLKNRKPKEWRDKQEIDVSGNINNPYEGLSTDDLKKMIHDG